jgi:hypothetical protein
MKTFRNSLTCLLPALLLALGATSTSFTVNAASNPADAFSSFRVRFNVVLAKGQEGSFVIEINPQWAPLGAERFREIIDKAVWEQARFFRYMKGFLIQW